MRARYAVSFLKQQQCIKNDGDSVLLCCKYV